ncbi:MAG: peptide ABC transporter substrate-binding protein, partial [Anaerolineales bacterium]|nr:peptide ABC transporter substrate-binding protein [Anaerolineales bacterium]
KPVTLNRALGSEPPHADPALATDTTSVTVVGNIFMGLTHQDQSTFEIEPYLAESWEAGEDADGNQTWTFKLREDIPWVNHNPLTGETTQEVDDEGNPRFVNAHDVVYGVKRTINPDTASDYSYVLYVIKNAEPVNTGEEGFTLDDVGVVALDDYTVQFTLENPAGYFPAIASMWVAMPQPQWVIEGDSGEDWTEAGIIVTNGPYVMESWIHGGEMTFVKNALWPDADSVEIERIEAPIITETSTEFALYENNELDTAGVPLPETDRVKADPVLSAEFRSAPIDCTYYYGFVNNKAPFDDVRVRRAFSASIDRQSLIDNVLKGGQIPATSFASPGMFGAPEPGTVGQGYDLELAQASLQEFLDEMGITIDEFNSTYNVTLMHNTSEAHAQIAGAIQQMWADALGAEVNVENQEWGVYLDTIRNVTPIEEVPHIFRLGWCADYPDENNWVHEVFNAQAGANRLRRNCLDDNCSEVTTSEFDDLTVAGQLAQDPEERIKIYAEAEQLLAAEEAAYAPIYHYTSVNVTKPWLTRTYTSHDYWPDWTIDMDAKLAATQ